MTKVRTRLSPKNFAVSNVTERMLALDQYCQINVIEYDSLDYLIEYFNDASVTNHMRINFKDIINANIIYSFAEKKGIKLGLFIDGDLFLAENIQKYFSMNIQGDAKKVLDELKTSWKKVVSHPIARPYVDIAEGSSCIDNGEDSPIFPGIGSYEFFMLSLFGGVLNTFIKQISIEDLSPLLQLTNLLWSSFQGEALRTNYIDKIEFFSQNCYRVTDDANKFFNSTNIFLEMKNQYFQHIKGSWVLDIVGWTDLELMELEDNFSKELVTSALKNLYELNKHISDDEQLSVALSEIHKYLVLPANHFGSSKTLYGFMRDELDAQFKLREAIRYAILKYARAQEIELYPCPKIDETELFLIVGEEGIAFDFIVKLIQDGFFSDLKPYQLYSILRRTKYDFVKEIINNIIDDKKVSETAELVQDFIIENNINRSFVPQFNRLSLVMMGKKFTFSKEEPPKDDQSTNNILRPGVIIHKKPCIVM